MARGLSPCLSLQDFTVGRRLEKAALVLKLLPEKSIIHEIPVVRQSKISCMMAEKEWLDIFQTPASCRGITDMSYGHISGQGSQAVFIEDFRHQPLSLDTLHVSVRADSHYAASFLAAMLESMEAVIREDCGIRDSPDAEDSAFFIQAPVRHRHFPLK